MDLVKMNNSKERFYELYLSKKQFSPKNFIVFDVFNKIKNERLGEICYKDYKEEFNVCSGSVGLLKDNKHKGYCRLYYTYREKNEDGTINITFTPAYTKDGESIFIKSSGECTYCIANNISDEKDFKKRYTTLSFVQTPL